MNRCLASTVPGRPCVLITSPGVPWEHHLRCAVCLLWGADLWLRPSWQMWTVQDPRKTWLATGSLLTVWWRMPVSGAEIASHLPDLAIAHLPLCPWRVEGPVRSQLALLWCLLNPLFCEQAKLCLRLELFAGKFSLFFSLSLVIPQFGLLAPSVCPQGIQAWCLS